MTESDPLRPISSALHFKVFISSPSGLDDDKSIVVEEIRALSERAALNNSPVVSVMAWPSDIAAGTAGYGQSVINRQTSSSTYWFAWSVPAWAHDPPRELRHRRRV
jgi:hypothetical protein